MPPGCWGHLGLSSIWDRQFWLSRNWVLGHSMSHSVGYNVKWVQPKKTKAAGREKMRGRKVGFGIKWSQKKASLRRWHLSRSLKGRVSHSDAPGGSAWAEEPALGKVSRPGGASWVLKSNGQNREHSGRGTWKQGRSLNPSMWALFCVC